jgi:hypothetical protein
MTRSDPWAQQTAARIKTLQARGGPPHHPHTTDYQEVISNVEMCLDSIRQLEQVCPLDALADYAEDHDFAPKIAQGFRTLEAAACPIVYDGPELIDDFLNELKQQGDPDQAT